MKAVLYIVEDKIGEVDFHITDESMGAIGGVLIPTLEYGKYKSKIQELTKVKGIANVNDFMFSIILSDNTVLNPDGGIGITDVPEVNEVYVEVAGISHDVIKKIE